MTKKTTILTILDGWGINDHKEEKNAITSVDTVNYNRLVKEYPNSRLDASGEAVGLPEGQMGNSEVGHLNIGAGRVVYQPLVKISKEVKEGTIKERSELKKALDRLKGDLHLGGLVSDGGVHSHINHLVGLVEVAKEKGIKNVYIHCFLDGRDTPPKSAKGYVETLEGELKRIGLGKIATISGRYYAMDRDTNWDRTEKAYNAIALGEGEKADNPIEAIEVGYGKDIFDEFVAPTVIGEGAPLKEGDVFVNFNFRPDRARQITRAITDKEFSHFDRRGVRIPVVCMRQYDVTIEAPVIYDDEEIKDTLGEVVSKAGLTQLRTAETEKYAHVTFFFNGGKEAQYEGEDRKLVASPKVATYDLKPEMSAYEVLDGVLESLDSEKYDMIILNFANPDMVGHTGDFEATKKAIETVDECLGKVADKVIEKDGVMLVVADHGNAEKMEDPITHAPFTAHTTNEVPFIMVSNRFKEAKLDHGKLADLAPTMLDIIGVKKPEAMTGRSLIKK